MASAVLIQNIEKSRQEAIASGNVLELKKSDIQKESKDKQVHQKIKYRWYQTPSKVGIEIPNVKTERKDLKVDFQKKRVIIDFPIADLDDHFHLDLELFGQIIVQRSKKIHRLNNVQIMMEKKQQNSIWQFLSTRGEIQLAEEQQTANYYPSSAKNKRNWDKIGKEIDQQISRHGEDYGEDPGMQFFKEIFKNADPDKRRAMMKSMQTSGGTVLSTDWDDVSKKDYEGKDRPSPPKGQQYRKREY